MAEVIPFSHLPLQGESGWASWGLDRRPGRVFAGVGTGPLEALKPFGLETDTEFQGYIRNTDQGQWEDLVLILNEQINFAMTFF